MADPDWVKAKVKTRIQQSFDGALTLLVMSRAYYSVVITTATLSEFGSSLMLIREMRTEHDNMMGQPLHTRALTEMAEFELSAHEAFQSSISAHVPEVAQDKPKVSPSIS